MIKLYPKKNERPKVIKPVDLVAECNFIKEKLNAFVSKSNSESKPINAFAPKNYSILTKIENDWNGDKIQDIIIIYDSIPSSKWEGLGKRPLIALKGLGKNEYQFWFRNDDAVPCRNCSGNADPQFELSQKKGFLTYTDISLISSTVKNIKYTFDKNLDLSNVDIDVEEGGNRLEKKHFTKEQFGKINLTTINIKNIENKLRNTK